MTTLSSDEINAIFSRVSPDDCRRVKLHIDAITAELHQARQDASYANMLYEAARADMETAKAELAAIKRVCSQFEFLAEGCVEVTGIAMGQPVPTTPD